MVGRHGQTTRVTPISRREPGALTAPAGPAYAPALPGQEGATRQELVRLAEALLDRQPSSRQRAVHALALSRALDWLETFAGEDWQDRWLHSGSDQVGHRWLPDVPSKHRHSLTSGIRMLIVLRAIRPTYAWFFASRLLGVYSQFREHNHAAVFAAIEPHLARADKGSYSAYALTVLTHIAIVTGRSPRDFDTADFNTYRAARAASGRPSIGLPLAYEALQAIGGLVGQPSTLRQAIARGQLTVPELVDRYPIVDTGIRDLLVHYLVERSTVLDYSSLSSQVQLLADLFWCDLERHHPGINSLRLSDEAIQGWKQRLRTLPDGSPRKGTHLIFLVVRALYLDLQQWALEDPDRWAQWAAPSPITEADLRGQSKADRLLKARMQARTRTLVPVLPRLIATAQAELEHTGRLLAAMQNTEPEAEITVDGRRYHRTKTSWKINAVALDEGPRRFDVAQRDCDAFWTWATIEVLRRTGVRVEELLELTHVGLRQYQAPTGEMVPLLQISPSKTDAERVIPADPDLVSVLAKIIRRVKDEAGRVPLVQRFDEHEQIFGPPLPHLFQHVVNYQRQVISTERIRSLLRKVAGRADLRDVDGTPLRFTPHDFRRVFSTEVVNGGLPIHIAAKLLGHLDLNTTQGYVAVYPEEVISRYRAFVDQRRQRRPSEEYREPSDSEWNEFRDHFSLRKVALGTCERPYGTPCQHEHACVRCPMLRMAPAQMPRLLQIETNTHERLEEARRLQWLGEVSALEENLRHIADKKRQAERQLQQTDSDETGPHALN